MCFLCSLPVGAANGKFFVSAFEPLLDVLYCKDYDTMFYGDAHW